ncbi:hypothetical protein AB1N83_005141 [Pleurotus pulmonarius]
MSKALVDIAQSGRLHRSSHLLRCWYTSQLTVPLDERVVTHRLPLSASSRFPHFGAQRYHGGAGVNNSRFAFSGLLRPSHRSRNPVIESTSAQSPPITVSAPGQCLQGYSNITTSTRTVYVHDKPPDPPRHPPVSYILFIFIPRRWERHQQQPAAAPCAGSRYRRVHMPILLERIRARVASPGV